MITIKGHRLTLNQHESSQLFHDINLETYNRIRSHGGWIVKGDTTMFVSSSFLGVTKFKGKLTQKERVSYRHNDGTILKEKVKTNESNN